MASKSARASAASPSVGLAAGSGGRSTPRQSDPPPRQSVVGVTWRNSMYDEAAAVSLAWALAPALVLLGAALLLVR